MNVTEQVLELLQQGSGPISGEEMAERLKVSRNAVWKAVKKLKAVSYTHLLLPDTPGEVQQAVECQRILSIEIPWPPSF